MSDTLKTLSIFIRHSRYRRLNLDFIGYALEEVLAPLDHIDFLAFARASSDNAFIEQTDGSKAPPLYLAKLIIPMLRRICLNADLRMNLLRMVHADQSVSWHQPLKAGDAVRL